jgi:hypothetical protein
MKTLGNLSIEGEFDNSILIGKEIRDGFNEFFFKVLNI